MYQYVWSLTIIVGICWSILQSIDFKYLIIQSAVSTVHNTAG